MGKQDSILSAQQTRGKLRDPEYKGEDFEIDRDQINGPLAVERSCTDVLCCLVFLFFCVGLGGIAIYGYQNGDVPRLLAPVDADGRFCGIDSEVKDYPLYYIVDINVNTDFFKYGVCVKSCPKDEETVKCVPTEDVPDCNN